MANFYGNSGGGFRSANGGSDSNKIFIGGLSWETTVEDLRDHFEKYGGISDCVVSTDPSTGRSKGFGFVTFDESNSVNKVLEDTHTIQGRSVEPQRAKPRERGGAGGAGGGFGGGRSNRDQDQEPVKKLYIGGIDEDMTESDIRDYFSNFGSVSNVHLPVDRATGQRRPFAFVEFDSENDAERVLANTGHNIGGRDVDVQKPRSDSSRGGGRGRGGFRGNSYGNSGGYSRGGGGRGGRGGRGYGDGFGGGFGGGYGQSYGD